MLQEPREFFILEELDLGEGSVFASSFEEDVAHEFVQRVPGFDGGGDREGAEDGVVGAGEGGAGGHCCCVVGCWGGREDGGRVGVGWLGGEDDDGDKMREIRSEPHGDLRLICRLGNELIKDRGRPVGCTREEEVSIYFWTRNSLQTEKRNSKVEKDENMQIFKATNIPTTMPYFCPDPSAL